MLFSVIKGRFKNIYRFANCSLLESAFFPCWPNTPEGFSSVIKQRCFIDTLPYGIKYNLLSLSREALQDLTLTFVTKTHTHSLSTVSLTTVQVPYGTFGSVRLPVLVAAPLPTCCEVHECPSWEHISLRCDPGGSRHSGTVHMASLPEAPRLMVSVPWRQRPLYHKVGLPARCTHAHSATQPTTWRTTMLCLELPSSSHWEWILNM